MTLRVCAEPGCPTLGNKTRCGKHERAKDKARGTSTQRGYGYAHQQDRAAWAPVVATGTVQCRRCPRLIRPDEPWDLGHPDAECPKPTAPEHEACNRSAPRRIGISPGA